MKSLIQSTKIVVVLYQRSAAVSPVCWLTVQVMLFLRRLETDHDRTPPTLRRSVTEKQAVVKHQACGCFLHFLRIYERLCPSTEYGEAAESLTSQFMSGFLDPDLGHVLEATVPPGDPSSVAAFRPGPSKVSFNIQ